MGLPPAEVSGSPLTSPVRRRDPILPNDPKKTGREACLIGTDGLPLTEKAPELDGI